MFTCIYMYGDVYMCIHGCLHVYTKDSLNTDYMNNQTNAAHNDIVAAYNRCVQ